MGSWRFYVLLPDVQLTLSLHTPDAHTPAPEPQDGRARLNGAMLQGRG